MCKKLFFLILLISVIGSTCTVFAGGDPVVTQQLTNRKAGISVWLSGTNGTDWAIEHTYHDTSIADQLIYLKSNVSISLAHNERNSIMKRSETVLPAVIGINGYDGVPDSGDEGDIHYKIDRDMQSHRYSSSGTIPSYAPIYSAPFKFDTLTYNGVLNVLGTVGDNGADWGSTPRGSTERFGYGQNDAAGNEWHTLTYWDDDEPVYQSVGESSHRQGASDGHWVYICVNPVTPVIQFNASGSQQYYTTPLKTYHVPKTWQQTTYLTSGVQVALINLTNGDPVYWRVDGGEWQQFGSNNLVAGEIFTTEDAPSLLEVKAGTDGVVLRRDIIMNPGFPAPTETHGNLLWANETERQAVIYKLANLQPFKISYSSYFLGDWYQKVGQVFEDTRDGWCAGASQASLALSNAFAVAIDGPAVRASFAAACKKRLLRAARLEAVGFEDDINNATPSKDYLNELGQTIQQFADAGIAYDMLAAHYRNTQDPDGITPIEEIRIRDGLGEIAKTILQVRANWSYTSGAGDTHWAHGYELAFGIIASAMPTYKTPYFGVSGGDMTTINDLADGNGKYWNPFPDQGVTWYECATDAGIDTPGHPNVRAPLRSEFQMSDDGYWMGPNNLVGDGNRYVTGPLGNKLVDVKYGGLANAENRVELVEMDGYESPFVTRIHVLDFIRRLKGDTNQFCVTNYIRRRLVAGYIPLSWDLASKTYSKQTPRAIGSMCAFNNHYEAAPLQSSVELMTNLLTNINRYYGIESGSYPASTEQDRKVLYNAYILALCAYPGQLSPPGLWPNNPPIIKPTYKYVVKPGEYVFKQIIAMDPDDDLLTVSVSGLPGGAAYNSSTRTITWTPETGDAGVHIVTITADDGTTTTSRPFPIIVKPDAGSGPIPASPTSVNATLVADNEVVLVWAAPGGVDVAYYVIYRDGSLHDVADGTQTSYIDTDAPPTGSHTRYHVALYATSGAESIAVDADPAIISVPGPPPEPKQLPVGDFNGDGVVDLQDIKVLTDDWLVTEFVLNGLVSYYRFNGNASDSVGGNNGTEVGNPTYAAGRLGQAISLDGAGDYVNCGNDASFNITSAITISAWIKGTFDVSLDRIIEKGYNWMLCSGYGDNAAFYCLGFGILEGSVTVGDNQWHHLAGVFDGSKMYLYVDGDVDVVMAAAGSLKVSTTNVYVGGNTSQSFNGLVDDVRIYNRALLANEVRTLYCGPATDLVNDFSIDFRDFAVLADNWLQ